jgi:hypothetical protein
MQTQRRQALPSDFVFYHSEGNDKPIGYRSPVKKKKLNDSQDAEAMSASSGMLSVLYIYLRSTDLL